MEATTWADWAAKLGCRRVDRALSQQQLADKAGIERSSVHYYETAQRTPSFDVLMRLLEALGTTPAQFFSTK